VFVREQTALACLLQHGLKEGFGNVPIEQALAVFGEHGHIPDGVIHVQPHEPTEQQIVVELFHQQPFAAHRVQRLQQQRSQQLLRRDRRSPGFGIQFAKPWLQFPQGLIGHATKSTQRVVLGHSLLRADVAEHVQLLLVLSTHTFFLSGCLVETREFLGTASSRVFPQPAKEWEAFLDDFQQTLDKFAVPAAEQAELKAIVNSTRADIVIDSTPAQGAA